MVNNLTGLRLEFTGRDAKHMSEADRARALEAFGEVLATHGLRVADAASAYREQWSALEDELPMEGAALAWVLARDGAARAAVEEWADPDRAEVYCEPRYA